MIILDMKQVCTLAVDDTSRWRHLFVPSCDTCHKSATPIWDARWIGLFEQPNTALPGDWYGGSSLPSARAFSNSETHKSVVVSTLIV